MSIAMPTVQCLPDHEDDLRQLGDEIAELAAHLDAATARLLDLIREFDARGGWGNGFRSCAEWLTWRIGLAPGAAREHVRVVRALGSLPQLAEALARGELSYSKIRALTRVATSETEERLLKVGRAGTAAHVERIIRAWRYVDRKAEVRETAERHRARALHVYQDEDGMVIIRGRLEPEAGAVLMQALAAGRDVLFEQGRRPITEATDVPAGTWNAGVDEPPAWGQLQADALALIAETGLQHGIDPGAAGERYQVVVHVDAAVLADAEAPGQAIVEGARVSAELVFRTPHGCRLPAVPVPVRAPVAAVENLRKKSPQIDERTSMPSWDGERLDLEWAISVLHPLACRPSVMGE